MSESVDKLKSRALGKWDLAWAAVSFFTPGAGAAICIGSVIYFAGVTTPIIMVVAGLIILVVAFCLSQFSRKIPTAGSFYTFTMNAVGFRMGWIVAGLSFMMWALLSASTAGIGYWFLWWVIDESGFHIPWWIIFTVGFGFVAFLAWIGVEASFKFLKYSVWFQIVCILVLSVYVMMFGPYHGGESEGTSLLSLIGSLEGLKGISGIAYALIWGALVFLGFEAVVAMGEEARNPLKSIGFGLITSIGIGTLFYIFYTSMSIFGYWNVMSGWTMADPPSVILGKEFWGFPGFALLACLVTLGLIGPASAGMMGVARIIYSLGRSGMIPAVFSKLDSKHKTPSIATLSIFILGLIVMIPGSFVWSGDIGPLNWCLSVGLITAMAAALACYGIICIGTIFYYRRKHIREFSKIKHGIIPALGALLIAFIYIGVFFPPHIPEIFDMAAVVVVGLAFFASGIYLQRTRSKEKLEKTAAIIAGSTSDE